MLIGLEALPDATSDSIRQRWLGLEMSAAHALDGAWRAWSSGWGERTVLSGHTDAVGAVAFSPDGARVLTGSYDGMARLWDIAAGKIITTLSGHANFSGSVAL